MIPLLRPWLPLLALLLALLAQGPLRAQTALPDPLAVTVSDYAEELSAEEVATLDELLLALRADPGVELAIAILPKLTGYAGVVDIEQLGKDLFNSWGIGHAQRNDGVLIVLALEEQAVRVALGTGYDPVWDGRAHRIIETFMLPLFAKGDYAGGLQAGVRALEQYLIRPHAEGLSFDDSPAPPTPWSGAGWFDFLLFAGFILLGSSFILWDRRQGLGNMLATRRPCPQCGARGVKVVTIGAEGDQAGMVRRHCPHCGWHDDRPLEAGRDDHSAESSESGDSGGFGGGQSSGGGASGRW